MWDCLSKLVAPQNSCFACGSPLRQANKVVPRLSEDVGYCVGARGTNLRKTPRLDRSMRAIPRRRATIAM